MAFSKILLPGVLVIYSPLAVQEPLGWGGAELLAPGYTFSRPEQLIFVPEKETSWATQRHSI